MSRRIAILLVTLLTSLAAVDGLTADKWKTSMAGFPLRPPAAQPLTDAVYVDASSVRFSHTAAGNKAIPPNLGHDMADINARYASMVGDVLFPGASEPSASKAALVLESVEMVQVIGKGFVSFDVTEQLTASWGLYAPWQSEPLLRITATGSDSAKSGSGKNIPENARQRMGGAYQALLQNTITAFRDSAAFSRFAAMPALFIDSANRVATASRLLDVAPAEQRAEMLDSIRNISVARGDAGLYEFARSQGASGDESELLHPAIAAPRFSNELVIELLGRVDDIGVLDDEGLSPLEASLMYGRDPVAVALVEAGADPVVNYAGNSFVSAEITYRLTKLLAASSAATANVAREAINQYRHAIEDANFAIRQNDASIFAADVMRVLGPVVQFGAAIAEAGYEARQSAASSPVGQGYGYAEFRLPRYDSKTPAAAIEDLRGVIAHCEARIEELELLL